jgi:hypothetical protein
LSSALPRAQCFAPSRPRWRAHPARAAQTQEDRELKERLELAVDRLKDPNAEVQKLAMELLKKEIRESTRCARLGGPRPRPARPPRRFGQRERRWRWGRWGRWSRWGAAAFGAFTARPFVRAAALTWQLCQLAVAVGAFEGVFAQPLVGYAILVPTVVALVLLFLPSTTAALRRDPED